MSDKRSQTWAQTISQCCSGPAHARSINDCNWATCLECINNRRFRSTHFLGIFQRFKTMEFINNRRFRSTHFLGIFQRFKIEVSREFDSNLYYKPWNQWRPIIHEFLYFRQKYSVQNLWILTFLANLPRSKPRNIYINRQSRQKYSVQNKKNNAIMLRISI